MTGELFETPAEPVDESGDQRDIAIRQYVNRWVLLKQQRPAALMELRELIAATRAEEGSKR